MARRILLWLVVVLTFLQPAISLWTQSLSEEFTTVQQLNSQRWSSTWIPAFYWQPDPSPNGELQTYRPDAFNFNSTTSLGIKASSGAKRNYNAGVISSKDRFKQRLGYFEFQARMPTAKGIMASFSLFGLDTTVANQSISIKVVLSNPRRVYFTQQCGPTTNQTSALFPNITDLNMHKFGIEWSTSVVNYFIDDVLVSSQNTCTWSTMYIAAHLIVGGDLAGSPDTSTPFPVNMDLDYIRAYSYTTKAGTVLPGPGDGVPNANLVIVAEPRLMITSPSISNNVAHVGDTVVFNITILGGGTILNNDITPLDKAQVEISLFQLTDLTPLSTIKFTNVTLLPQDSITFTSTVSLQGNLPGYYRLGLVFYEANRTKILGFNTVEVLQVVASSSPPTIAPVSPPPVTPPVSSVVTSNVIPILDCYAPINATHYRAYFSYENKNNAAISIPVGSSNKIAPGAMDRGQPTVFSTGRSALFPNNVFATDVTSNIGWVLSSYTVDVDIADTSSLCQSSVTIVIVVSSPTPINSTNVSELKDAIASQLNVTSDSVQVSVTCTTATNCEISVTISADQSQISELIQKAKEYATNPATVENTVKQVSTDLSVTEVRGTKTNTEKQGTISPMPMSQPISSSALKTGSPLLATLVMLASLFVM